MPVTWFGKIDGLEGHMGPVMWPKLRSRAVPLRWQFNAEHGLIDSRQVAGSLGSIRQELRDGIWTLSFSHSPKGVHRLASDVSSRYYIHPRVPQPIQVSAYV